MPMVTPRSGYQKPKLSVWKNEWIHFTISFSFEKLRSRSSIIETRTNATFDSSHHLNLSYKAIEQESNTNSCQISHSNSSHREISKNSSEIADFIQTLLGRLMTEGLPNWIFSAVDLWRASGIETSSFCYTLILSSSFSSLCIVCVELWVCDAWINILKCKECCESWVRMNEIQRRSDECWVIESFVISKILMNEEEKKIIEWWFL